MEYRYEAASVEGFVQLLAASFLPNGYWFYVSGVIPARKDPRAVDGKLFGRYDITASKWARVRRKRAGQANVQYLRFGRFFVLLATHGEHRFFEEEARSIRDARRAPIRFHGYAVSFRGGHTHVRIEQGEYNRLKGHLMDLAMHRSVQHLVSEFSRVPFEPYAPVRRQLLVIWRAVNRVRKSSGHSPVPKTALRMKRRLVRPFGPSNGPGREAA